MLRAIFLTTFFLIPNFVFANCNFVTADYIKKLNNPTYIEQIKVETPKIGKYNKNLARIISSRSINITPEFKKKFKAYIKVIYSFGDCKFEGKIRQVGDNRDHIQFGKNRNPYGSINVELKNGNILNATKFKLFIPQTRGNLHEILGSLILRKMQFITPETFQIPVTVNGNTNMMLFQENTEKELLERNKRVEGPLFEGDETILWSYKNYNNAELSKLSFNRLTNKEWFLRGPNSRNIVLNSFGQLQNSQLLFNSEPINENLNIIPNINSREILTQYFLNMIILRGEHGLSPSNRKYYYNQILNIFEPVYYDGNFKLTEEIKLSQKAIVSSLRGLKNFKYKEIISSIKDKNSFFKTFHNRTKISEKKARDFFDISLKEIKTKEIKILKLINENKDIFLKPIIRDKNFYFLKYIEELKIKNLTQKTITNIKEENEIYNVTTFNKEIFKFEIDELAKILNKNKIKGVRYVYIPESENNFFLKKTYTDLGTPFGRVYHSPDLVVSKFQKTKTLIFKQKNEEDWAIINNAILRGWNIIFQGIIPKQTNYSYNNERINEYGLTGCLNFYKTEFFNTSISLKNGFCEDSLNIINSKGILSNVTVQNAVSDAIDIDFSQVQLDNVLVTNAGNDCLDVSWGQYKIKNINNKNCKDKAISVGERSNITINAISVINANIGLSSKDLSIANLNKSNFKNVVICLEAKMKKQEFGGAKINTKHLGCDGTIEIDINSRHIKDKI